MRGRIKQLEEEAETAKATISTLRKELDHLTLSHSQILVENTKLTNDKLRLEQDIRKMENRYDVTVRSLHDKFSKEVSEIGLVHESVPRCVSLLIRDVTSPYRYAISIRSTIRIEQECKNSKRQIKSSGDTWRYARLAIRRRARVAFRRYLRTPRSSKLAIFCRNINLITLVVSRFLDVIV